MTRKRQISQTIKRILSSDKFWFTFFVILHFITSLWLRFVRDLDMAKTCGHRDWNYYWQTLSTYWLKHDFIQSILNLHAQPPLLNIFGGICIKIFGPYHLQALNTLWIIFGSLGAGFVFIILRFFLQNRSLAILTTLFLSAMPSWYLYEAYLLYTLPSAMLILAIIAALCRYSDTHLTGWLLTATVFLNALILFRSAYHLVLLAVFLPFTAIAAGRKWPRVLAACLLISLISTSWYLKNAVREGFFGSSSWVGMNIYKNATRIVPQKELLSMVKQAKIPYMCYKYPRFSYPFAYKVYGFHHPPAHPVQAGNDFNSSILPEVYSIYGQAAGTLHKMYPEQWHKNTQLAYGIFVFPSSKFKHVNKNLERLGKIGSFWTDIIDGYGRIKRLYKKGISMAHPPIYYILPLLIVLYGIGFTVRAIAARRHFFRFFRKEWPLAFTAGIIIYTTIVSCAGEYSENNRFRFMIELPTWIFGFTLAFRPLQWAGKKIMRYFAAPDVSKETKMEPSNMTQES